MSLGGQSRVQMASIANGGGYDFCIPITRESGRSDVFEIRRLRRRQLLRSILQRSDRYLGARSVRLSVDLKCYLPIILNADSTIAKIAGVENYHHWKVESQTRSKRMLAGN